jgi:hypothetical protein
MTLGDRQSYYEDCHTLHDGSRRTRGSTSKGCLSKGYCSPARTLRVMGTAHNGTPGTRRIFLTMEDCCSYIFLLIFQIKRVLKDLEANPKDSGDKYQRLLDKPFAYPSDPWMAGLFFRFNLECRSIDGLIRTNSA